MQRKFLIYTFRVLSIAFCFISIVGGIFVIPGLIPEAYAGIVLSVFVVSVVCFLISFILQPNGAGKSFLQQFKEF
jgi:uncharacterized membrane protein YtjA (UPF0391 family)